MKKLALLASLFLCATAVADDKKAAKPPIPNAGKTGAILLAPADLLWMPGTRPGTWMAPAEGDPDAGPAHFFQKYEKGFVGPEHAHTNDHGGWILAGTVIIVVDGVETRLPAGSFYFIKGGKPHTARCDPAADCVMTVDVRGKWDVLPVAPKK